MVAREIMTTEETADYLRVPVQTLYAWRHQGIGPRGARVGRYIRYRRGDVDAWLAAQAERPADRSA